MPDTKAELRPVQVCEGDHCIIIKPGVVRGILKDWKDNKSVYEGLKLRLNHQVFSPFRVFEPGVFPKLLKVGEPK